MKKLIGLAMGMGIFVANALGAVTITPNDDAYIDETQQGTTHDAPTLASAGIFLKNQSGFRRVGYMEYTIPSVTATAATFNLTYFRSQTGGTTGAWTFRMFSSNAAASFDETTVTWTNALAGGGINTVAYTQIGPDIAMGGGTGTGTTSQQQDVVPNVPVSVDILAYFNAHQGQTVVFKLTSLSTGSTTGGTFQDRELSRVMTSTDVAGQVPNGPFISYEAVPEPSAALLLLGALPMLRRRCSAS